MGFVSAGRISVAILHFVTHQANVPTLSMNDPRFVLFSLLALAMGYYVFVGISRYLNRRPQIVVDRDGIALGFGRDLRFAWDDIQWARLRRLALRPQLEIGIAPPAFIAANLRLSMWSFDDALSPIPGLPPAGLVRANGLHTPAPAMLAPG